MHARTDIAWLPSLPLMSRVGVYPHCSANHVACTGSPDCVCVCVCACACVRGEGVHVLCSCPVASTVRALTRARARTMREHGTARARPQARQREQDGRTRVTSRRMCVGARTYTHLKALHGALDAEVLNGGHDRCVGELRAVCVCVCVCVCVRDA